MIFGHPVLPLFNLLFKVSLQICIYILIFLNLFHTRIHFVYYVYTEVFVHKNCM
jgi:hypothetical protein